jgi:hypothetical protein
MPISYDVKNLFEDLVCALMLLDQDTSIVAGASCVSLVSAICTQNQTIDRTGLTHIHIGTGEHWRRPSLGDVTFALTIKTGSAHVRFLSLPNAGVRFVNLTSFTGVCTLTECLLFNKIKRNQTDCSMYQR